MKPIRAFIALNLPADAVQKAMEIQTRLRQAAGEAGMRVGWVRPANMHLTLKFLGDIVPESTVAIAAALQQGLAGRPALELSLRGVGAFPDPARPRVLWLGLHTAGEALPALAGDVEAWLDELGFPREKRPYHPHLTLGRVKAGRADLVSALAEEPVCDCTASEVVLYESRLMKQGAEYKAINRISLGAQAKA